MLVSDAIEKLKVIMREPFRSLSSIDTGMNWRRMNPMEGHPEANLTTMKKALMILSSVMVSFGAFAQGQVNFAARVLGVYDAPVFLDPFTRVAGPGYMVQLYAAASATDLPAAIGAPLPFNTGPDAGYWTAEPRTINTVDGSGNAYVQIRAWATDSGGTYEAALSSGSGFAVSNIVAVKPTVAPDAPATLVGLQSFSFGIPEPSIMALGALGGLALLLHRRK